MNRLIRTVTTSCTLALALLAGTAAADQIYRSVDAEGNVTFSSQPPPGAVNVDKVTVHPGPSDAEQREARERMQRQEATASEMSEARTSRGQQPEAGPTETVVEDREVEPVNQYYGYPDARPPRRDRPVQLPARPVQLPARPALR